MTGTFIGLQVLCVLLLVVSLAMGRVSRHPVWLWLMGLAGLGIVVCAGLAYWALCLVSAGWTRSQARSEPR